MNARWGLARELPPLEYLVLSQCRRPWGITRAPTMPHPARAGKFATDPDWLGREQTFIEAALARRHLRGGALLLYDVTSTYPPVSEKLQPK